MTRAVSREPIEARMESEGRHARAKEEPMIQPTPKGVRAGAVDSKCPMCGYKKPWRDFIGPNGTGQTVNCQDCRDEASAKVRAKKEAKREAAREARYR